MYLYKATCPDIPNPKQKVSRTQGGVHVQVQVQGPGQGKLGKQTSADMVGRSCNPVMLWTSSKNNSAAELKQLEEFLNFHSLSLLDTVKSRTGMIYR